MIGVDPANFTTMGKCLVDFHGKGKAMKMTFGDSRASILIGQHTSPDKCSTFTGAIMPMRIY